MPMLNRNGIRHVYVIDFPRRSIIQVDVTCIAIDSEMTSIYDSPDWVDVWASAISASPCSVESVVLRLDLLLDGKSVDTITRLHKPKTVLAQFVRTATWEHNPAALDAVWQGIFTIAARHGWTEEIREETYFWTEQFLLEPAWDTEPLDEREEGDEYDNVWITTAFGSARLFSLGYGYSSFTWNALLDGLALNEGEPCSDSMRIGSCAQLLGGGMRIKEYLLGKSKLKDGKGFAGRWLNAPSAESPESQANGESVWDKIVEALKTQQSKAGPRAAKLLEVSFFHCGSYAKLMGLAHSPAPLVARSQGYD
jgi:hypothetical protein